ncbi:hypothetical protein [Opitutus terrae]|uniref:Uncharacterized protein n=1 Tax=Opitutus terrae (strain DSM 11246 / JCM 15787 / PB90-1) TaxID=452637 RepID=B1ZVP7_OPITP|nr:hypothetical protein [Opitutus terrae]ACB74983.1 hypothetical protein Oter_1699 [Opitutus terrae PB90-1]
MTPGFLEALCARQPQIREHWAVLLRIEPANSPLALPDTLVHLIPDSVQKILAAVGKRSPGKLTLQTAHAIQVPVCGCNRNPYLAYFKAGEQALLEAAVTLQAEQPLHRSTEQDLAELVAATRRFAAEEIEAFCGICTHRGEEAGCRHFAGAHA